MRYLIHIKYDGSEFYGFQRLNKLPSVQKELERVLSIINNKKVEVKGAGRTDALVHAIDQCVHFDLEKDYKEEELRKILNKMLNEYISVDKVEKVSKDFHARFSVKEKTYLYKIYLGEKNPFYNKYAYWINRELDIEKMIDASNIFLGEHNFHNFVSGRRDNYNSVIKEIEIKQKEDFLFIEIKGKSFYRYMVRSIVGALILVGLRKIELDQIKEALDSEKELKFFIAPPNGLYLKKIMY